jgi:hypothetical protein
MTTETKQKLQEIEEIAAYIFQMVDRVKSSEPKSGYDTFKQAGEAVKAKQEDSTVVTDQDMDNDIDLSSIPF